MNLTPFFPGKSKKKQFSGEKNLSEFHQSHCVGEQFSVHGFAAAVRLRQEIRQAAFFNQKRFNVLGFVELRPEFALFRFLREGEYVYYVHSFYAKDCAASTLAVSDYSIPVTGAVRCGKVYGTQFHPEKSGDAGLRILRAFAAL